MTVYLPTVLIAGGFLLLVILMYRGHGYGAWVGATIAVFAAGTVSGIEMPMLFWSLAGIAAALAALFGAAAGGVSPSPSARGAPANVGE